MGEVDRQEAAALDGPSVKAAGEAYLAQNRTLPSVKETASGLQYKIVRTSKSASPRPGPEDEATVEYEGRLIDGRVFDPSHTTTYQIGGIVPRGLDEALQLMHPGDVYEVSVPSALGYGAAGNGLTGKGAVPPNAVLVYKIELLFYHHPVDDEVVQ